MRVVPPVRVAPDVKLENVTIGPNVTIEPGCEIRDSELSDCIVGAKTRIHRSKLYMSLIGDHAVVERVNGRLNIGDHAEVRA